MTTQFLPANPEIQQVFATSIQGLGGTIHDVFDDGELLFLRAAFPQRALVKPRDRVRGGVALRAVGDEVTVHPYVLRQVCTNGAMLAHSTDSRRIRRADFAASQAAQDEILQEVHEVVFQCARGGAFEESVSEMRAALTVSGEMDLVLSQVASFARHGEIPPQVFDILLRRLKRRRNPTRFDLMNVVTAVARDVPDPQIRWRLEELGGGVLAARPPAPQSTDCSREVEIEPQREACLR